MSELKFKTYDELEISEALSDASHVIIEENGDVKRFPVNSIGKVKTVNGIEPDESGNVTVEIPEGFSGNWNDLSDKPFGEMIVFTEVITETECASLITNKPYFRFNTGDAYRVTYNGTSYDVVGQQYPGQARCYLGDLNLITYPFCIVYDMIDAVTTYRFTDTSSGVTASISKGEASVVALDEKYIPDTIARISDIPKAAAVSDVIAAPTAEEFNALLTALRNAGLMATE